MDDIPLPTTWRGWLALLAYLSLEWWLGRTHHTPAGSVVDLAWLLITKRTWKGEKIMPSDAVNYETVPTLVPKEEWELLSAIVLLIADLKKLPGKPAPSDFIAVGSARLPEIKAALDGASKIPDEAKADPASSVRAAGLFVADLLAVLKGE